MSLYSARLDHVVMLVTGLHRRGGRDPEHRIIGFPFPTQSTYSQFTINEGLSVTRTEK